MAIDTAVKRQSMVSMVAVLIPLPDSTIDQGDRQTFLRLYSGILSGVVEEVIKKAQKISIDIGISI